jgi:hypothetical protein
MTHKYAVGQHVLFESRFGHSAATGEYEVTKLVPVENDNRLCYRIKNPTETFERTAEEHQLSRTV